MLTENVGRGSDVAAWPKLKGKTVGEALQKGDEPMD